MAYVTCADAFWQGAPPEVSTRFDPHGMLIVSPGATLCAWLRQRALVALQFCRKRMLGLAAWSLKFHPIGSDCFRLVSLLFITFHYFSLLFILAIISQCRSWLAHMLAPLFCDFPLLSIARRSWNKLAGCFPVGHRCSWRDPATFAPAGSVWNLFSWIARSFYFESHTVM